MRILGISGSLRAHSKNAVTLEALREVAHRGGGAEMTVYDGLRAIPPFDPDEEPTHQYQEVFRFREALRAADAVVISSPEYAHGIPGQFKNALDWVVGTGEFSGKRVALLHASSRGEYARAALQEVLRAMDARVIHEAEVTLELAGSGWGLERVLGTAESVARLKELIAQLSAI